MMYNKNYTGIIDTRRNNTYHFNKEDKRKRMQRDRTPKDLTTQRKRPKEIRINAQKKEWMTNKHRREPKFEKNMQK